MHVIYAALSRFDDRSTSGGAHCASESRFSAQHRSSAPDPILAHLSAYCSCPSPLDPSGPSERNLLGGVSVGRWVTSARSVRLVGSRSARFEIILSPSFKHCPDSPAAQGPLCRRKLAWPSIGEGSTLCTRHFPFLATISTSLVHHL